MAVRAPDFRPELEWIHTGGKALSLASFRGRLLLLDFWTYGCINCVHLLGVLHEVEARFGSELAVVGVHSGKFINERDTRNIARACERLGVRHPVVNDRHFRTWREYAVRAWPTLVVVSPTGYVLHSRSGETTADRLTTTLAEILEAERAAGRIAAPGAAPEPPASLEPPSGALRFPAKLAFAADGTLFVSDTGHHRVVEVELSSDGRSGRVVRRFGNGEPGWRDGPAEEARFRSPHGIAASGGTLFVADTENHLVRAVDLASGTVETRAGTGKQAWPRGEDGPAREVPLNSPWDLLWHRGSLLVAMAGSHQIWRIDERAGRAEALVGSGAEGLFDAPLPRAALAQPSGLTSDGERILFADPEASAVRRADLDGSTDTLVGTGLFDFGDRDGAGDEVRLQHPLGVAWWPGRRALLVADTYNHRLKLLDPETRRATAFAGDGLPGFRDGAAASARFWEPGGIALHPEGARAYVADTNNHAVRVVDLRSGAVGTVGIVEKE